MGHKKHKRKFLNILLIPDNESSPRSLKVRYSLLTTGIIMIGVLVLVLLVGAVTYGKLLQKAFENISLRQENKKLQEQLQELNKLQGDMEELKSLSRKVRNSLTGYVEVAENIAPSNPSAAADQPDRQKLQSIFTSIPLKAPVAGFISQEFNKPVHNGIDIVAAEGTPVQAAGAGTVLYAGWTMDGGHTIIIGHSDGYYTYYKHNLRNLVSDNQYVEAGQVIAYLGNSGQRSYGPHLHFEIWREGKPLNPKKLIQNFN